MGGAEEAAEAGAAAGQGGHLVEEAEVWRDGEEQQPVQLTLSINARNLLNNVNAAVPSAVLNPPTATTPASASAFFAVPNATALGPFSSNAANRQIYLQASFSF